MVNKDSKELIDKISDDREFLIAALNKLDDEKRRMKAINRAVNSKPLDFIRAYCEVAIDTIQQEQLIGIELKAL